MARSTAGEGMRGVVARLGPIIHRTALTPRMSEFDHFVARQAELDRLRAMLDLSVSGAGQVCFVAGEAGTGKTALSDAFQRMAQSAYPELVIAGGVCDAQVGDESPYAPFHDILAALTNGVASRAIAPAVKAENSTRLLKALRLVVEAVGKFGPDLVGVFIPGTPFVGKLAEFVIDQAGLRDKFKKKLSSKPASHTLLASGSLTQDQVIEQFVNVLRDLASKMPLLLVLDDLHWADTASIDLIFRLIRRLADCRIFMICALRPHDLQVGRDDGPHPMEKVINEARRQRGDIWLDLTQVSEARGREFVDALIDAEPNRLDRAFRDNLYAHTEGHPLFTVELMRDFRDRGVLTAAPDGALILASAVDWSAIPARVEGVVAGRLSGLPKNLRELLDVAAVEGNEFTAELAARVQSRDGREVVRELSGHLQGALQLVRGLDARRVGAQRLSRYRFSHQLVQKYLYGALDAVERSYLHESVGLGLEALYGPRAEEIAPQLARHFEVSEIPDKARLYLGRAGAQAAAAFANEAALEFLNRALALTPAQAVEDRIELLLRREGVYSALGRREPQRADLDALQELAGGAARADLAGELLIRRARLALDVSDYAGAIDAAGAAEAMATQGAAPDRPAHQVEAMLIRARAHFMRSEADDARTALEAALTLSRQARLVSFEARALEQLALLRWSVGDYQGAQDMLDGALALTRANDDLRAEWSVLNNMGVVATEQRDFERAARCFAGARAIVARTGQRAAEARLLINEGDAGYEAGDYVLARDCAKQAFDIAVDVAERQLQAISAGNLAETLIEVGDYAAARRNVDAALSLATEIGFRRGVCACREWLSRILLAQGDAAAALAEAEAGAALAGELRLRTRLGTLSVRRALALARLGRFGEALEAGEAARALATELGAPALAAQADAARVLALLARAGDGDSALAMRLSRPEIEILGHAGADGAAIEYPLWTHLALVEALMAAGDPRAAETARAAVSALKTRAARIGDLAMRRGYVDDVPEHAALQRRFAELAARAG